jgi:hypothetical protein
VECCVAWKVAGHEYDYQRREKKVHLMILECSTDTMRIVEMMEAMKTAFSL